VPDDLRKNIPDSYCVVEGLFCAGEYPSSSSENKALRKAQALVDAGVRHVIDLTEEGEYNLRTYAPLLKEAAVRRGVKVRHVRRSIPDLGTPAVEEMKTILDAIDGAIATGSPVYVHCFGGIGRTGTVVGCHLVRHGLSGEEAILRIARWREGTPDGGRPSPEMPEQVQMVLSWEEDRHEPTEKQGE